MKKIIFTSIIAAAMSAMIFLPSCNKDDNEVKISHKDSANVIEVLTKSQYAVGGNFSPNNGAKDIYVGTDFSIKPGVALNTPFDVKLADQTVTYRYDLKACTITDVIGADFATDYNYSEQDTLITINSKILNGNTEYTLSSTIALMQQINGEWQPVVYNGDAKEYVSTSLFTTCQAADTLRPADILFSYPIDRQLNYMPKEYQEGYIMLSYKYPELFNGASANDMKVIIKNITDDTKAEQSTPFTVKESHEVEGEAVELGYSLKDIMFDPNQIYSLAFYCGDKKVHQIYFRTSFYETLKSKLAANETSLNYGGVNHDLSSGVAGNEFFDKFEYQSVGENVSKTGNYCRYPSPYHQWNLNTCLVTLDADLDNWEWYQNSIYKVVYNYYKSYQDFGSDKIYQKYFKYPPSNAMEFWYAEGNEPGWLTDDEINNKQLNEINTHPVICLVCYQSNYMQFDLNIAQNIIVDAKNEIERQIDNADWHGVPLSKGDYPFFISFRLPGKNIITSQERYVLTLTDGK